MKPFRAWIYPLFALSFAAAANAAQVQYQITGFHIAEFNGDGTSINSSELLMAADTSASITFFYDSTTPATSTDNPDTGLGPYSYYTGSVSNLSGTVLGHSFFSSTGDTTVFAVPDTFAFSGMVINSVGTTTSADSPSHDKFIGSFSIGDFSLVGADVFAINVSSGQSMPDSLAGPIGQIQLDFRDSNGELRLVGFLGQITTVPLPNTLLFFASGLIGLVATNRRKFGR